jgi:hypothetical protein
VLKDSTYSQWAQGHPSTNLDTPDEKWRVQDAKGPDQDKKKKSDRGQKRPDLGTKSAADDETRARRCQGPYGTLRDI